MPRKQTTRPSPARSRRPTNGGGVTTTPPYIRDTRWSTPTARRRTDVYVVDVTDRYTPSSTSTQDDPLLLTA